MVTRILVVGAAGKQGGATVRALLSLNNAQTDESIVVHALVRPTSNTPISFAEDPRVKIFQGNFDDLESLKLAAEGCAAAFLNVTPVFTDMQAEARHCRNLLEACASISTLKRIVFSSSAAMHRPHEDPIWSEYVDKYPDQWMSHYMRSKRACETAVINTTDADFPEGWCIIRGSAFLSNFLAPDTQFMYPELESKQTITTAISPEVLISVQSPEDIGSVAAPILTSDSPTWEQKWQAKSIPIAKESLTIGGIVFKMNEALRKVGVEKQIKLIQIDEAEAERRASQGDMIIASDIFRNKYQKPYDMGEVRAAGVDVENMISTEAYFEMEKEKLAATVGTQLGLEKS